MPGLPGFSSATSSGVQAGAISNGDIIVGGSKLPTWALIGLGLVAVLWFFSRLLKRP